MSFSGYITEAYGDYPENQETQGEDVWKYCFDKWIPLLVAVYKYPEKSGNDGKDDRSKNY